MQKNEIKAELPAQEEGGTTFALKLAHWIW